MSEINSANTSPNLRHVPIRMVANQKIPPRARKDSIREWMSSTKVRLQMWKIRHGGQLEHGDKRINDRKKEVYKRRQFDWTKFERYMSHLNLSADVKNVLRALPVHDRLMIMVRKMQIVNTVCTTNNPTYLSLQPDPHGPPSLACSTQSLPMSYQESAKAPVSRFNMPRRPLPPLPVASVLKSQRSHAGCALCQYRESINAPQQHDHDHYDTSAEENRTMSSLESSSFLSSTSLVFPHTMIAPCSQSEVEMLRLEVRALEKRVQELVTVSVGEKG